MKERPPASAPEKEKHSERKNTAHTITVKMKGYKKTKKRIKKMRKEMEQLSKTAEQFAELKEKLFGC